MKFKLKKKKAPCRLKHFDCKKCQQPVRCESCGLCRPKQLHYLFYKVYTQKRGNHIFCKNCLGRYLIDNEKPTIGNSGDWWITDQDWIIDIVRYDKSIRSGYEEDR